MTSIWSILCLCFVVVYLFYRYFKSPKNYLKELDIPFMEKSKFSLMLDLLKIKFSNRMNFHAIEIERYKKYGRLYGTSEEGLPAISISHPDLIRKILAKDFHVFNIRKEFEFGDGITDHFLTQLSGEKWKRIRTIITPAFSTGKIKRMTNIMISCAKTLTDNLSSAAGEPIDGKFFYSFTMDVTASIAFGIQIYSHNDPKNRFVQEANKFFNGIFSWQRIFSILCPRLANYLGMEILDRKMINFFKDTTLEIIKDRKENGTVKNDFLQLLMEAEEEHEKEAAAALERSNLKPKETVAEELGHNEENTNIFKYSKRYKSLSSNELLAQCVIFFLGGYDSTASALTCLVYELAMNPDIQETLKEEIDATICKHNNRLTYEAVQEMKYLDKCVTETLRKYPPVFRIERRAGSDYELEGTGITIKKGTVVLIPVCAIHQDPDFYPEPEVFNPERFSPEERSIRHQYSYLAFGGGPRNCVAMRFTLTDIKLCISYVLSHLIIKKCPETEVPMKMSSPVGFLKPEVVFTVEKRKIVVLQNDL